MTQPRKLLLFSLKKWFVIGVILLLFLIVGYTPIIDRTKTKININNKGILQSVVSHDPINIDGNIQLLANFLGSGDNWTDPVRIENYEINANISNAIYIRNTDKYLLIQNSIIFTNSTYGVGIRLRNSTNVLIINCSIRSVEYYGLRLEEDCLNVSIVQNRINSCDEGGIYSYTHNLTVIENNISNCIGYGISSSGSNNLIMRNNVSYNGNHGISLSSSYNTLTDNHLSNNNLYGIFLSGSYNNLSRNNMLNNNGFGLYLIGSFNNLTRNVASNNNGYGFFLNGANNNVIENIIRKNAGTGIYLSGSYNNLFRNNVSFNSGYYVNGIYSWGSNNNIIENYASYNDGVGINSMGSNTTLTKNNASDNRHSGITFYGFYGDITNNYCSRNLDSGIRLQDSDYTVVTDNECFDNLDDGISIFNSKNNQISNNNFSENAHYGVYLDSSVANDIHHNILHYNGYGCIHDENFGLNSIYDNDCINMTSEPTSTAPSAPQSLSATPGENFVDLSWTTPADDGGSVVTSYCVYRGASSGTFILIGVIAGTSTSFNDTTAMGGTMYYYVVTAVNAIGESGFSNEASVTPSGTPDPTATAPSAPQSLSATVGDNFVTLSWTTPGDDGGSIIIRYHVYRGTATGIYFFLGVTTSTIFNDTTAIGGTTHYYVVTAINAAAESTFSNEVSATPTTPATTQIPKTTTTSATTQETISGTTTTTTEAAAGTFPGVLTVLLIFSTLVLFNRQRKKR